MLFYFCSFAGAFMVVGGIVLLYKEKIYIDRESNQITEIETPIGRFRTNLPALLLFALGFIPLIYPIWQIQQHPPSMKIHGRVTSNIPVRFEAVVEETTQRQGVIELAVPPSRDRAYKLLYSVCDGSKVIDELPVPADTHDVGEVVVETSCGPELTPRQEGSSP